MTEAWFMLVVILMTVQSQGGGVATATRDAFATEQECLDAIPAQAARIRKLNPRLAIPDGALGFVCVRGVRR